MVDRIKGKSVVFTLHSLRRLRDREITRGEVIRALRNADTETPAQRDRRRFMLHGERCDLHVIAEIKETEIVVITAYRHEEEYEE